MKTTFYPSAVLQELSQAACVINAKNAIPILNDFLIEGKSDHAVVTASDSEIWLSVKLNIETDTEEKVCINATNLVRALRNLDDDVVTAEFDNETHIATFWYGSDNGYFKFPFTNDEFPAPPDKAISLLNECHEWNVSQEVLHNAINNVDYAVSFDPLRPIMNGVHFDFYNDGLVTAATDSFKLGRCKDESIKHNNTETPDFTLPTKASNALKQILGNESAKLKFNDNYVSVECERFKFVTRLVEGIYPKYNTVIPKEHNFTAHIVKGELLSALKRVSPMGNTTDELVKLEFTPSYLTISAENIDFNTSAKECIACEFNDAPITIGFKGSVLIDTLRHIPSENIWIEMTSPMHAVVIHKGDKDKLLSLIMPMAVN